MSGPVTVNPDAVSGVKSVFRTRCLGPSRAPCSGARVERLGQVFEDEGTATNAQPGDFLPDCFDSIGQVLPDVFRTLLHWVGTDLPERYFAAPCTQE